MRDVAALYIDPRGPYPKLLGPELCWDEQRDARLYDGPHPVVAHPPCGPWGRLFRFCTRQPAELGPIAVAQVRKFGGVLEHPAWSRLFDACGMPRPGELPDAWGGRTLAVDQVSWGHRAQKATWLYIVGVSNVTGLRSGGTPTHVVNSTRKNALPELSKEARRRTPVAFAEFLIALARQARQQRAEVA